MDHFKDVIIDNKKITLETPGPSQSNNYTTSSVIKSEQIIIRGRSPNLSKNEKFCQITLTNLKNGKIIGKTIYNMGYIKAILHKKLNERNWKDHSKFNYSINR